MSTKMIALTLVASLGLTLACENKAPETKPEATEPVAQKAEATKNGAAAPAGEKKVEEVKKEEAPKVEVAVGKPAPDFTLTDEAGKEHKLSSYKGKIVVLEWTSPGCPYVKRHYDVKPQTMATSHKEVGGPEKVVWLAVDSSHFVKAEEAAKWKTESGFAYPVLMDASGTVGKTYQAKTTPHMFVVDAEGVLRYSGAIDDNPGGDKKEGITNYVTTAVKSLQEGKPVEMAETKPYGCSVKFGS